MPTEQELLARLAARAEALDLAVARLSQEEINDYVALLEERSRVAEIVADTGTGPIRLVLPPGETAQAAQNYTNTLRELSDNADSYREQSAELEFLALYFRHRDVDIEWDRTQTDANGCAVFCLQCAKPGETIAPICLVCKTDRWLIMRRRPS